MGLIAEGTGLGSCRVAGIGFSGGVGVLAYKPIVILAKGNCSTFHCTKVNFNNKNLFF
jgi:hypothetical protein